MDVFFICYFQSKETVLVKDSSDDFWFLEESDDCDDDLGASQNGQNQGVSVRVEFSDPGPFGEEFELASGSDQDVSEGQAESEESADEVSIYSTYLYVIGAGWGFAFCSRITMQAGTYGTDNKTFTVLTWARHTLFSHCHIQPEKKLSRLAMSLVHDLDELVASCLTPRNGHCQVLNIIRNTYLEAIKSMHNITLLQSCTSSNLATLVVTNIACLLPAGRCWIGLGSNPTGVEFQWQCWWCIWPWLTLKVLVTTIDTLGHFWTGQLQYSGRGWGM